MPKPLLLINLVTRYPEIERVFTFERFKTRSRFEKDAAKRKNVGPVIDLMHTATRLFRRHVSDGPHYHSGN